MGLFRRLPPHASEDERLRWIRRFYVEQAPAGVLVWILFVVFALPAWAFVVLGIVTLFQVVSYLALTRRIRRASADR